MNVEVTSQRSRHKPRIMQLSLFPKVPDAFPVDNLTSSRLKQATDDLTPLGQQTLEHWSKYRPKMVAMLTARNQLQQAIFAAQELTGNLLYELAVVRKMEYQIAWELATREWAFLPDEEDRPQLSFDPATLDPKQPLPAITA